MLYVDYHNFDDFSNVMQQLNQLMIMNYTVPLV